MHTLFPIFILAVLFAYLTEITSVPQQGNISRQSAANQLCYALLLITLTLPLGLRRIYNDTGSYIRGFSNSLAFWPLLTSGKLTFLNNPAFMMYTALVRTFTDNYHIYFMIAAIFVQYAYVSTMRKYSPSFTFSIAIYICLGTYVFSIAAMKQVIAMAILLLALPSLIRKKYWQYYLLVFIAFLFHTYAIAFVVLPFLNKDIWSLRTFLIIAVTILVMKNFESVIGSFLDYANEQGKNVADYEVFDNNSVNIFRVMVYGVVPLLSLVFRRYLIGLDSYNRQYNLFLHMAIISFAFMMLGTIQGANMFARMAIYFEFGIILSLPWVVSRTFVPRSAAFINLLAVGCFFLFFFYANAVALNFDTQYRAISISEFFASLISD